jgi:hypothetical protein
VGLNAPTLCLWCTALMVLTIVANINQTLYSWAGLGLQTCSAKPVAVYSKRTEAAGGTSNVVSNVGLCRPASPVLSAKLQVLGHTCSLAGALPGCVCAACLRPALHLMTGPTASSNKQSAVLSLIS